MDHAPSVIWITGYSSSGKSTVARELVLLLKELNAPAVLLDGDNLRNILRGKWGYTRLERIELAKVYFQLSSYISSQGLVVVIAAVALYEEIKEWIDLNVGNSIAVFLNVPESERLRRDSATKSVYQKIASDDPGYNALTTDFIMIDNYDGIRPREVAEKILDIIPSAVFSRNRHSVRSPTGRPITEKNQAS